MRFFKTYLLLLALFTFAMAHGQERTRILFVFDASNSMNGYWEGKRKIDVATKLLGQSMEELYGIENLELGLRVYGHQTKHIPGQQDCADTELVTPIGEGTNLVIKKELERITPQGTTPIARSLEKAAMDFDSAEGRNVIILITDGIEACDEDPCAVSRALQAKNIIVKPFIIGIGIDDRYKSTFECVGNYFDASDESNFEMVLNIVITQAINSTTAQVNLNDINGNAIESDMPFSLIDSHTGKVVYDYVHTLNSAGLPDTLTLDPIPTYTLKLHSWPIVIKNDIRIKPGQHNEINVDAGQGNLEVKMSGLRSEYQDLKCLVYSDKQCELIHSQNINTSERYLVGTYSIDVLTTPITHLDDVVIEQSNLTTIQIPTPGGLLLQTGATGHGGLFIRDGDKWDCVIRFEEGNPSGKYTLQPGSYKVIFRSRNARQTIYTLEKEFQIKGGSNTSISLN